METNLVIEINKVDMKFGKEFKDEKPKLDFFIRYCHPSAVGMLADGIITSIHRFKEDKDGKTGLCIMDKVYPSSFSGLNDARADGLTSAMFLYNINRISMIEVDRLPFPNDMDCEKMYRLNFTYAIQFLNPVLH